MPIIKARPNRIRSVRHICRLQEPNRDVTCSCSTRASSGNTVECVLNQLIETMLIKDRDFLVWRAEHSDEAVVTSPQCSAQSTASFQGEAAGVRGGVMRAVLDVRAVVGATGLYLYPFPSENPALALIRLKRSLVDGPHGLGAVVQVAILPGPCSPGCVSLCTAMVARRPDGAPTVSLAVAPQGALSGPGRAAPPDVARAYPGRHPLGGGIQSNAFIEMPRCEMTTLALHSPTPHSAVFGRRDGHDEDLDELLTVADVAALLKVSKSWVYEHTRGRGVPRAERLPHVKIGKYVRFEPRALRAFIEKQCQTT